MKKVRNFLIGLAVALCTVFNMSNFLKIDQYVQQPTDFVMNASLPVGRAGLSSCTKTPTGNFTRSLSFACVKNFSDFLDRNASWFSFYTLGKVSDSLRLEARIVSSGQNTSCHAANLLLHLMVEFQRAPAKCLCMQQEYDAEPALQ